MKDAPKRPVKGTNLDEKRKKRKITNNSAQQDFEGSGCDRKAVHMEKREVIDCIHIIIHDIKCPRHCSDMTSLVISFLMNSKSYFTGSSNFVTGERKNLFNFAKSVSPVCIYHLMQHTSIYYFFLLTL